MEIQILWSKKHNLAIVYNIVNIFTSSRYRSFFDYENLILNILFSKLINQLIIV